MKTAVALLLTLATAAHAELVLKTTNAELRLLNSPCVHGGTLALIKDEYRPQFKKARITVRGNQVFACWIDMGEGSYFVMIENGETLLAPVTEFTDEPGA